MPADCSWPDACLISFQHGLRGHKLQPGSLLVWSAAPQVETSFRGASVSERTRNPWTPSPWGGRWSWIPVLPRLKAGVGRNDQADVLQCDWNPL